MQDSKQLSLEQRIEMLERQLNESKQGAVIHKLQDGRPKQAVIILFSQDLDKVLPAWVIASSAASLGIKVKIFCTFWGVNAIKKKRILSKKKMTEKVISILSPKSFENLPMGNLHKLGVGPKLLKYMMKEHKVPSQEELLQACRDAGVEFYACELTLNLLGISKDELMDGVVCLGVAKIISDATESSFTLFI